MKRLIAWLQRKEWESFERRHPVAACDLMQSLGVAAAGHSAEASRLAPRLTAFKADLVPKAPQGWLGQRPD